MDFLKEKATSDDLRIIKTVTGLAVAAVSAAASEEVDYGDLAVIAAGTTISVINTSEKDTTRFSARSNAIWETVGTIATIGTIARLFS